MKKKKCEGMVDISAKPVSLRVAIAEGHIQLSPSAFQALVSGKSPKGDVLATAKTAGIMAAKITPSIIPLCHPLMLSKVKVECEPHLKTHRVIVRAEVRCEGKTGVEMEALTAVSAALLTIYDMMKWAGQTMTISKIHLLEKSGGQSGDYRASL